MTNLNREVAIDNWFDNQDGGCSCHLNAPCQYCTNNYGLPLSDYLESIGFKSEDESE